MLSKNLIDLENLSVKEILDIIDLANKIKANPSEYANACQGKNTCNSFLRTFNKNQNVIFNCYDASWW